MKLALLVTRKFIRGLTVLSMCLSVFVPVGANMSHNERNTVESIGNSVYLPLIKNGNTYFISPWGNDNNSGTSESEAWATFDRALNVNAPGNKLAPGDVLVLMDGVYYQTLEPHKVSGVPGKPITIRAQHDGEAIIDGQGNRFTVDLKAFNASYYVLEGIVARNSSGNVYRITADNNILRRVSGFNANTDGNNHVFVIHANNTLIEDCVAAGSGRKMMVIFQGENNIIRRCFADWQQWDGREWHDCWPWGDGIEIYNSSNNIIENSIAYSRNANNSISFLAQGDNSRSSGNKILGTMSILSGMKEDGTPMVWGDTRPQPTDYTCVRDPPPRRAFSVYQGGAEISDNLWQDIFAWGGATHGIYWRNTASGFHPNTGNNRVNRATLINNGLNHPCGGGWPCQNGGPGTDALQVVLDSFDSVENSYIERVFIDWPTYPKGEANVYTMNGEGARLTHRYVDGVLTEEPLWPWSMEERIQEELGISVTEMMTNLIFGTANLDEIYPKVDTSTSAENK